MRGPPVEVEGAWLVVFAGLAVALLSLGAFVRGVLQKWSRRRRMRGRMARAQRGEREAEALLERAGWAVVGCQVQGSYGLWVGGRERPVALRADYLVEAQGRRFVAEVKTGTKAVDLGTPATRRQLLEYRVAFDVEGVLLVDAEAGRVEEVRFPLPGAGASKGGRFVWLLAGLVLGAGGGLALETIFFSNGDTQPTKAGGRGGGRKAAPRPDGGGPAPNKPPF